MKIEILKSVNYPGRLTTMFHGHNGVKVIQRYGLYIDESYVYVGLGGATFTEEGNGMVRTWEYQVN